MARRTDLANPASSLRQGLRVASRERRHALCALQEQSAVPARNDVLPNLTLVPRAPDALGIPTRNVRKADREHRDAVIRSITALGFCQPVLIDAAGTVLDGAVRVEAARALKLPTIPCILVDHLDAGERRLLRLALNRLQERGAWDLGILKVELGELMLEEAPLEITGFALEEVDQILLEAPEPIEPGPVEPDAEAEPIAKLGDVYQLGPHRLICGDARDPAVLAALMQGEAARLVLTDEPYNVPIRGHVTGGAHREFAMASGEMDAEAFAAFNAAWIGACLPHLVEGGVLGSFIDWRGQSALVAAAQAHGLAPLNLVVWSKTNAGMGSLYRSQHELLPLFKKGTAVHVNNVGLGKRGRWRSNVWVYPGASSLGSDARRGLRAHPTVKPVAMLADALLDLTHRDDVVLDPFLGSGSALIAAEQTGRRCFGVELDPRYVDLIVRRYQEVTGKNAVIAGSAALPMTS